MHITGRRLAAVGAVATVLMFESPQAIASATPVPHVIYIKFESTQAAAASQLLRLSRAVVTKLVEKPRPFEAVVGEADGDLCASNDLCDVVIVVGTAGDGGK